MKKYQKTLFSIFLAGALLSSCVSTPDLPGWVQKYPADPQYYIGIGSSQTGVMAEDTELAKARALASLAGEISTEIQSSTTYREVDDGTSSSRSAEQEISAVVDQNLQAVETVDSFYSRDSGAWYYVRLDKAEWEAIQQREMNSLRRRVMDLVEPVLGDPRKGVAEVFQALSAGWNLLAVSPYAGMIRADLLGQEGVLIDLLEKQIASEIALIQVSVTPAETSIETGRPARFQFQVSHSQRSRPGQLVLELVSEAGTGPVLFTLTTSPGGTYNDPVNLQNLKVGKNYLTARLDMKTLGLDPAQFRLSAPQQDLLVDLQQLKARLNVDFRGDVEDPAALSGVGGTVNALMTRTLPVKMSAAGETSSYDINFTLQYRNAPPNDYGLVIIYAKANVAVVKEGRTLYTYETPEQKGGGLNWSQANTKALENLFSSLEEDSLFTQGMTGAFALD
jgi:hypothetical protein